MGWGDVVIGNGGKSPSGSTVITFGLKVKHHISENTRWYWIDGGFLDVGMTIFKDTKEGMHLTSLIEGRKAGTLDAEGIDNWLDDIAIKHLEREGLRLFIERAVKNAYDEGSENRAKEIRKSLGIG